MSLLLAVTWAYETPHYIEWVYAVVGMAAVGGIGWIIAKIFNKPDRRYGYNDPSTLFSELCQIHNLPSGQRRLLKKLAAQHKLEHPAQIFLLPELLRLERLPANWATKATALQELSQRLFD